MTARRLVVLAYALLVDVHGPEAVDAALMPRDRAADRDARRAQLAALGVEVA